MIWRMGSRQDARERSASSSCFAPSASVLVATFLLASDHSSAVIAGTFNVRDNLSLTAAAGSMLFVFLCLLGVFGYLLRHLFVAERRSEEMALLAQVAGRTDHAVFFTDGEGSINWVNEGFIKMTGHALTDARGKQSATLFLGTLQNLNVVQKFREGLASHKPFVVEMLCSHRRGHRYWMSVNMTPLFDGHQVLTGFVGVGSDITARRGGPKTKSRRSASAANSSSTPPEMAFSA
jgi:PAS domain S-box-containing protein